MGVNVEMKGPCALALDGKYKGEYIGFDKAFVLEEDIITHHKEHHMRCGECPHDRTRDKA